MLQRGLRVARQQHEHGALRGLPMKHELKAVPKQPLQHGKQHRRLDVAGRWGGLGGDIESVRVDPAGSAGDIDAAGRPGYADQFLQGRVGGGEPAAWEKTKGLTPDLRGPERFGLTVATS